MYCRNCGAAMDSGAAVCVRCGYARGTGHAYCPNCGAGTQEGAAYCVHCGTALNSGHGVGKNRIVAGLLAIFLGSLGLHNFYLGNNSRALTQLLVSTIGGIFSCGIATLGISIWTLVEGVQILCGTISTDADGNPLSDRF